MLRNLWQLIIYATIHGPSFETWSAASVDLDIMNQKIVVVHSLQCDAYCCSRILYARGGYELVLSVIFLVRKTSWGLRSQIFCKSFGEPTRLSLMEYYVLTILNMITNVVVHGPRDTCSSSFFVNSINMFLAEFLAASRLLNHSKWNNSEKPIDLKTVNGNENFNSSNKLQKKLDIGTYM